MTDMLPAPDELVKPKTESSLLDAHNYWLKKRLIFNAVVGAAGIIAMVSYAKRVDLFDIIGILVWGFVANGLYSFGYVIESFVITKYPQVKFANTRFALFYIGTFLYAFVTFIYTQEYFSRLTMFD